MNQRNLLGKQEDQYLGGTDDAGLDLDLNAAIESNPFQKRRMMKEKAEKAPLTQSVEVPQDKGTIPANTNVQKSFGAQPQNNPYEYKKATYPETIKTTTEIPKKEDTTVKTELPKPVTNPYTRATITKEGTTPQYQPSVTSTIPKTLTTPTQVAQKEQTTSQPTLPVRNLPGPGNSQQPPIMQATKTEITRPATVTSAQGVESKGNQTSTIPPPTQTTQIGATIRPPTVFSSQGVGQPSNIYPPLQTNKVGVPPPLTVTAGQGVDNKVNQPSNLHPPVQSTKVGVPTPTTVPSTQGTENKVNQPANLQPPAHTTKIETTTKPPITSTGQSVENKVGQPSNLHPPLQTNKVGVPPPVTVSAGQGVDNKVNQPSNLHPPVQSTKVGVPTPTTVPSTQGTENKGNQPAQVERPPIANALASLISGQKSSTAAETKVEPEKKTVLPSNTNVPKPNNVSTVPKTLITPTRAPILGQSQPSTLNTTAKTTTTTTPTITVSSKELEKMSKTPKKLHVAFNNNRGFMLLSSKLGKGKTVDVQTTNLGSLLEDELLYPGPYKYDKKTLTDKRGEVYAFLEKKLKSNIKYFPHKLSVQLLLEYIRNNSTSIFVTTENKSLDVITGEILQFILTVTLKNQPEEYGESFKQSNIYLQSLSNPSLQNSSPEDLLFKALFLRNTLFNIDSENIDHIINYVKARFLPGDPVHTVAMVKLAMFHEIFESPFFTENDMNHIWPVWVYPILKYFNYIPMQNIIDFMNSLAYKISERHIGLGNGMMSLVIAILTGDFDGETIDKMAQSCKNVHFYQTLETYYYVLKATNAGFDKNFNLICKILPLCLRYASYLMDLGMYERSKECIDYIVSLRPFYQGLEKNSVFMAQIKTLRDFFVNHYTLLEETKNAQKQQPNFLAGKKEINQMATNTIQKIQAKSKSLFGFMGSALSQFMNVNEGEKEQTEDRKQEESTGISTTETSATVASRPDSVFNENFGMLPQAGEGEEGGAEAPKVDPSKQGKHFMKNPFDSSTTGGSSVGHHHHQQQQQGESTTPTTMTTTTTTVKKGIPKNRYVAL